MGFLDNIGKTISDVGQSTLQKGKDMVDVAKYNSMISDEEKNIQNLYEEIGLKYFEKYADMPEDLFIQNIKDIKESKNRIEEYKKTLETLRGVSQCPKCGAEVQNGSAFCPTCGTKIDTAGNGEDNIIRCGSCGAVVPTGCKFCTSCGKPIE